MQNSLLLPSASGLMQPEVRLEFTSSNIHSDAFLCMSLGPFSHLLRFVFNVF